MRNRLGGFLFAQTLWNDDLSGKPNRMTILACGRAPKLMKERNLRTSLPHREGGGVVPAREGFPNPRERSHTRAGCRRAPHRDEGHNPPPLHRPDPSASLGHSRTDRAFLPPVHAAPRTYRRPSTASSF